MDATCLCMAKEKWHRAVARWTLFLLLSLHTSTVQNNREERIIGRCRQRDTPMWNEPKESLMNDWWHFLASFNEGETETNISGMTFQHVFILATLPFSLTRPLITIKRTEEYPSALWCDVNQCCLYIGIDRNPYFDDWTNREMLICRAHQTTEIQMSKDKPCMSSDHGFSCRKISQRMSWFGLQIEYSISQKTSWLDWLSFSVMDSTFTAGQKNLPSVDAIGGWLSQMAAYWRIKSNRSSDKDKCGQPTLFLRVFIAIMDSW